ncbi:MAG: F0F1 ATP synthase subunit gamma [Arenicellales bacterium]
MESLERLQKQLANIEDLRDIVRTMKALSAASIRQYENAAEALADYYRTVELGLHAALRGATGPLSLSGSRRPRQPPGAGLIVFGSDHGLCGRFNEDVVAHAVQYLQESHLPKGSWRVLAVGARTAGGLEREGVPVEEDLIVPGSASRITATVLQLLLKIDEWRVEDDAMPVVLFYNRARQRNTSYRSESLPLLPLDLSRFQHLKEAPWPSRNIPGFSLTRPDLLSRLLRQYFFVALSRACADSQAAEHGSRLAAMQGAERNLGERLDEITMSYHRARQSVITSELLDVVSGFEAIIGADSDR